MIKGCLALGVIQSTHQFPDFMLKATEHFSLRLLAGLSHTTDTKVHTTKELTQDD